MAAEVLSGTGNVSYTNNTGQNVRVIINYLQWAGGATAPFTMSWGGVSIVIGLIAIGRNLATVNANPGGLVNAFGAGGAAPTEIMLAPGQTFSVSNSSSTGYAITAYNIVVIPEAG